jgi:hypothetical protein
MRATGTFSTADFTPAPVPPSEIVTALPVGVATMTKQFRGEIEGAASTIFVAAFDPASGVGTYVAMESFTGTVAGAVGSFNFIHSASTSGNDTDNQYFVIVPSSGTDGLAGITGTGELNVAPDDTHSVTLDYQLG